MTNTYQSFYSDCSDLRWQRPEYACTVLGVDPGGTTGVVLLACEPEHLTKTTTPLQDVLWWRDAQIDCQQADSDSVPSKASGHMNLPFAAEIKAARRINRIAKFFENPAVVIEDYIIDMSVMNQTREILSPVRITSMLAAEIHKTSDRGLDGFFLQNRGNVKTTCNDARLHEWGLYDQHSGGHARDAMRHAYYFLRNCRGNKPEARELRWRAWPHLFEDPQLTKKNKRPPRPPGERVYL